jgi:hypothetical protein
MVLSNRPCWAPKEHEMTTIDHLVQRLAAAPLRRFADWPPDDTLAKGRPGVYAIWAGEEFLFAGMSWKDRQDTENPQAQGVWGRLQTYMIRNPSSALITAIFDRYVRPALSDAEQVRMAADPNAAKAAAYRVLRRDLAYRAIVTADGDEARALSGAISSGRWAFGPPLIGSGKSLPANLPAQHDLGRPPAPEAQPRLSVPAGLSAARPADAIVDELAAAPLRHFGDWPDAALPKGLPGVYAIWCDDDFLYAGCAYRSREETTNPQAQGVWGRLQTHARATQPSQLSDGIFRHYILRELTDARRADEAFDPRVASREFLRERLTYRAVVTEDGTAARDAEDEIRRGQTVLGPPRFNSK